VFAFHPHESQFLIDVADLLVVPAEIRPAGSLPADHGDGGQFPDGRAPVDRGGSGGVWIRIVGMVTTSLLEGFPLGIVLTFDRYPRPGRAEALKLGFGQLRPSRAGRDELRLAEAGGSRLGGRG